MFLSYVIVHHSPTPHIPAFANGEIRILLCRTRSLALKTNRGQVVGRGVKKRARRQKSDHEICIAQNPEPNDQLKKKKL
jgi:hypothetical protein